MAEKRRGLGRGLGALISSAPSAGADVESGPELPHPGADQAAKDRPAGQPGVSRETERGNPTGSRNASGPPKDRSAVPSTPAASTDPRAVSVEPAAAQGDAKGSATTSAKKELASELSASAAGQKTARQRKTRPVDMFFAPGKSEEDGRGASTAPDAESDRTAAPRARTKANPKRPQMPDFIGEVRSRAAEEAAEGIADEPSLERAADAPKRPDVTVEPREGTVASPEVSRETLVEVPGASFAEIPVGNIHPNRKQPRTEFDQDDMAELVHSIKEVGLLQPIVVRPSAEGGERDYELVMGERRWRATQEAGLATIPAIVRATSDMDLLRDALLENLHRSQLNPLEEAAAYQQLLQEFGCTQEQLSDRIGRSRPQISNTIRLMKLPALVQRRVAAGVLSAGHARALLALVDAGDMERLAQRIVNEGLSVRATEEIVALSDGLRRPAKDPTPRPNARHERLDFLATALSDRLDTSVKITLGAKKGRVSIEFASVDDLNRIMGVIAPGSPN